MRLFRITALMALLAAAALAQDEINVNDKILAASDAEIPAGEVLQIRLRQTISTIASKKGMLVSATVIHPVVLNGQTIVPLNSVLEGRLLRVRRVELGFSRETAMVDLQFDTLRLPDEGSLALPGRVVKVDNSRESVDKEGKIHGIRATASFSNTIAGIGISISALDPILLAFALSSSLSVFRIPESEILLPAGAELRFQLDAPVRFDHGFPASVPSRFLTAENESPESQKSQWTERIASLPYRTATAPDGTPSDITSLVYVGSKEAIARAFDAAGWARADRLDGRSSYHTMRSIVENQGYRSAPLSRLKLNGNDPEFEFVKTLDTFFQRHHLRMYAQETPDLAETVFTSTATHDSGIAFSKAGKTLIHLIDPDIDEERDKVVYDLVLTGCVDSVDYLPRPWLPTGLRNATGDNLVTDGRVALIFLNACQSPDRADAELDPPKNVQEAAALRPLRDIVLRLKDDAFRGNVGYQSVAGARLLHGAFHPPADPKSPKAIHIGGETFQVVSGAAKSKSDAPIRDPGERLHKEQRGYASIMDISFSAGYSRISGPAVSTHRRQGADSPPVFTLPASLSAGRSLSPSLTLNFAKRFSHELSFITNTTDLHIAGLHEQNELPLTVQVRLNQFHYSLLAHLNKNGSRFRPYVAVGPAIQLFRPVGSEPSTNRILRFALKDLNLFTSAWKFSSTPPLDGGGIFQVGVQYGGGFKYQMTPRYFLRADFRQTLSSKPDFWSDSSERPAPENPDARRLMQTTEPAREGLLRQSRFTIGFGISF